MPWSNAIGVTPDSLVKILEYLGDVTHSHHEEYLLTPIQVFGVKSAKDFLRYAEMAFFKNSKKKVGRPPINAATWFVIRMSDGTWLTDEERLAYEGAALEEASCGGSAVGVMNSHRNQLTGAEDLNLLAAAFTTNGHLVRDRTCDQIASLRRRMDEVTDALNLLRRAKGMRLIQTMQEVKKARALERGEPDIVEMLARMTKPPRKVSDLEPALLSLECEITRFNSEKDTISFILKGKKRAKKFPISKLLADIAEMVTRLRETKKPRPEITPAPTKD